MSTRLREVEWHRLASRSGKVFLQRRRAGAELAEPALDQHPGQLPIDLGGCILTGKMTEVVLVQKPPEGPRHRLVSPLDLLGEDGQEEQPILDRPRRQRHDLTPEAVMDRPTCS